MTPSPFATLRMGAAAFFRWWARELLVLVPNSWRACLLSQRPLATIRPKQSRVEIELIDGREHRLLIDDRAVGALDEQSWAVLREAVMTRRATVEFTSPDVFTAAIPMPRGALGHGARMIALQLDRIAPVRADAMEWTWSARTVGGATMANVAMIRTQTIAALEQCFAGQGIALPAIALATDDGPIALRPGFDGSETPSRRFDRRLIWASAVLVGSIPFTTLVVLAVMKSALASDIVDVSDAVAPRIEANARIERRAAAMRVLAPLVRPVAATALVTRLAEALPNDAQLATLHYDAGGVTRVTIAGSDAATLQSALNRQFAGAMLIAGPSADTGLAVPGLPTSARPGEPASASLLSFEIMP